MGKGDKKTKRGKIILGSYGVRRPHKSASTSVKPASEESKTEDVKPKSKPKGTKKMKEE